MMLYRVLLFLLLNFGALAIGGFFTGKGVPSDWYLNLNKAPWTPPGWVFGAAWTSIMIAFAFYMSYAYESAPNRQALIALFVMQWVLNVAWNPVFFYYHQIGMGLVLISALTLLIGFLMVHYWPQLKLQSAFILPYFIWLLIATSLNWYALANN